jgi:cytochrome c-type biogenesis protein CcmH/NrfF
MSHLWRRLSLRRGLQVALLSLAVIALMGAGDEANRFNDLGHRMMCVCGCSQILLECNHVGCTYSDRMRGELMAALDRGDSDDLTLQSFVQKYGTTVIAAPTTTGFNRVAWIMPFLALGIGLAGTVIIVRAWKNRPAAAPSGVRRISGSELDRFRMQAREETDEDFGTVQSKDKKQ